MACNSFLIRVHGRVLSWCLCCVSAAEVLEVRFLPRCFFLARCSQAQSLLRCRSALHTPSSFEECVLTVKTQCVCVKESWFRVFINAVQHFKVHKDYKQDAGVCAAASSLSVYTTLHFFFSWLSLLLCIFPSLSSLQMMERYGSGRTLLTRRIRRWWRRGRVSPICCPLPEVSPPSAPTVKTNALYYCVTNPSAVPPIPQNHKLSQSIPVIRPHCSAYREGLRGVFFSP